MLRSLLSSRGRRAVENHVKKPRLVANKGASGEPRKDTFRIIADECLYATNDSTGNPGTKIMCAVDGHCAVCRQVVLEIWGDFDSDEMYCKYCRWPTMICKFKMVVCQRCDLEVVHYSRVSCERSTQRRHTQGTLTTSPLGGHLLCDHCKAECEKAQTDDCLVCNERCLRSSASSFVGNY